MKKLLSIHIALSIACYLLTLLAINSAGVNPGLVSAISIASMTLFILSLIVIYKQPCWKYRFGLLIVTSITISGISYGLGHELGYNRGFAENYIGYIRNYKSLPDTTPNQLVDSINSRISSPDLKNE